MLYEIIIGNYLDDTTKSSLILSCTNLENDTSKLLLGLTDDEYILSIKKPRISISAWTEEEWDELTEIKLKLIKH